MKKDILKGVVVTNIILVVIAILKIYTNRFFVLNLGLEKLGLIKLFEQILGYLSLTELGLGSASTFALYKPLANGDYKRVKEILYTIQKLYTKIIYLFLGLGALATFILPFIIKNIVIDYTIVLYWLMYLTSSALSYFMAKYIILYNADRRVNFVKISQGIVIILLNALQLISLIIFKSLFVFILLITMSNILRIIIFKRYYRRYYSFLDSISSDGFIIDRSIIKNVKQIFVHKVCYVIAFNTDLIVISSFVSLKMVGLYASYLTITMMILSFVGNFNSIIKPHIGRFIAISTKNDIYKRFKEINILYLFSAIILGISVYNLIQPFMRIWINNKFNDNSIIVLLSLSLSLLIYRECLEIFKMGSGFFSDIHLPIIESLLNLVISIVLVRYIGVLGVIIGTVTSEVIVYLSFKPILTYRECFDKSFIVYLRDYSKYIMYSIVSVVVSQLIINGLNLNIKSFLDFIISGFIIVILLFFINGLIFITNKEFRKQVFYSINIIKNKIA